MSCQSFLPRKFLTCLALVFSIISFWAQTAQSCNISMSDNAPFRQIIACGDAVTIEREPTVGLQITKSPSQVAPRVIEVEGGAILIQVSPGRSPAQVRTRHAIATVRGTTYIVDAGAQQTSVFVVEGAVEVRRANDASTFTLNAGEGTDVSLDEPISVQRWGIARAQALLSRFGR